MSVKKMTDGSGRWYASFYYRDAFGAVHRKKKEGFARQSDAKKYEDAYAKQHSGSCNMTFRSMYELYLASCETRLKEATIIKKRHIFRDKILPTFGDIPVGSITPLMIHQWQNQMMRQNFSSTYLRTINNDLAALFTFAERYYGLSLNPCRKEPRMGKRDAKVMQFWTLEQYRKVIAVVDDPELRMIYEILFWTGMRRGECLALTVSDIDLDRKTVSITKTLDRRHGLDVVTSPKTENSNRTVTLPGPLCDGLRAYIEGLYKPSQKDKLFHRSPGFVSAAIKRYAARAQTPAIRVHDLRHSHASMLIEIGCSPLLIAERLGHDSVDTTLRIYSHLYPNKQADVAAQLSALT
ncbi:site-specific integrase [Butyricicoccus faecihominis]|uniref:site-specific integrase n=1 Tax=Butyricicoccus faecihominis TaxID=1712515 RepID=UPI00247B2585|nr:site-specific integrase [Butyricicoccus faecihominis]MCQ5128282.1 site-specific integrase [Butyricicoccus faecihominis]